MFTHRSAGQTGCDAESASGARHINTQTSFVCNPVFPLSPPSLPPSLLLHPPLSSNTPESGDSVYVLRLLRPLFGFVQIGLFASPELPISVRRHHRVERGADVEAESPKGEGTGEGGGRVPPMLTLI